MGLKNVVYLVKICMQFMSSGNERIEEVPNESKFDRKGPKTEARTTKHLDHKKQIKKKNSLLALMLRQK